MASYEKFPSGLSKWRGSDKPTMSDFLEDNATIDQNTMWKADYDAEGHVAAAGGVESFINEEYHPRVVEYVDGLAPGVFVIVKGQNEGVAHELSYLMKKGERDHHILYRPYHLASLETPITIAKAVLEHDHAIVPMGAPVSETVSVTKKEIKAGERVDGIGGYCVRGVLETHGDMKKSGHIPIGLISGNVIAKRNIPVGTFITEEDVELDQSTTVWKLRKLQDETFG